MVKTDFETLKALAGYTVSNLKEGSYIEFTMERRLDLIDALATEFGVSFSTDEDIRQQAIEEVEDKLGQENIVGDVTETEMYNHARKEIIKGFNGEAIAGLYLEETLNQVAKRVNNFLLNSDLIEDVFGTDEEIINFLIPKIRTFSVKRA